MDDAKIYDMLKQKKQNKYTSPQIQNELMDIMYKHILCKIAESVQQARYFALMADEVTDSANIQQPVMCLHYEITNLNP